MRKQVEDESNYYTDNKLNIAFIAEDSKDIESISVSGSICDRDSLSSISRVASNSIPGSPFLTFQPEISNMEQWSNQTPNIFGKKSPNFQDFRKRQTKNSIPQSIQQNNEDEQQIQKISKCTKKRIGQKNKIITIPAVSFNQYDLRSKGKVATIQPVNNQNQSSSSEQLRQMVNQIGYKKNINKNIRDIS